MPTLFRGPRQRGKGKTVNIFGGRGGSGGEGGVNGGNGGIGEGSRVRMKITNFVRNNYSGAPTVRSGFRTIPLGDIDLQREIQLNRRSRLPRLHSAKIHAEQSNVTVALYQGDDAEDKWRRDIKKYMAIRHPNIVQLYGTASFGNIHAAIFHDDLIPLQHFKDRYKQSHFSTVYIHAYIRIEFQVCNISLGGSGPSLGARQSIILRLVKIGDIQSGSVQQTQNHRHMAPHWPKAEE
ncbi:hypothetical protein C8R45DRAFT_524962 [Mycena sanguinolenta]|nr:hypothetical protein C8R45DRAFT_524962 [Mycena sanguinolenta]